MAKLRTYPRFRAILSDGTRAENALLYTYVPGTTDNKATFQDKDGAVAHTNPIVLDANGEAVIYWDGEYDLRLEDKNTVLQWTFSGYGSEETTTTLGNFNLIKDGIFETDADGDGAPDEWVVNTYPFALNGAGSFLLDTADQRSGSQSLKFSSLGDGGGWAISREFSPVREGETIHFNWMMKSSVATVRNLFDVTFYTAAQAQITVQNLYDNQTTNPTSWTRMYGSVTVPATARYMKVQLVGCHSSNVTVGSTWFDDVRGHTQPSTLTEQLNDEGSIDAALTVNSGGGTNVILSEDSLDRQSASRELFDIRNGGAGDLTVNIGNDLTVKPSVTGGTTTAYTATLGLTALETNRVYELRINQDNTDGSTIDFDGLGVKAIVKIDGTTLLPGELKAGMIAKFLYDATNMVLLNPESVTRGALVYTNNSLILADEVSAYVDFELEDYDIGGFHDNVTNPSRLTITGGVTDARLSAQIYINDPDLLSVTNYSMAIHKNGSFNYNGAGGASLYAPLTFAGIMQASTSWLKVQTGDYFQVSLFFNTSDSSSISTNTVISNWFCIETRR